MTEIPDAEFLLPLFPLPNLVFFPQTRIPIHIFEPRYRQLVADVMKRDQRFGIVLLQPGWEADYLGAPPVHLCGTMGRIEHKVALDDERFNLILYGETRFRILGEVEREPYRTVRVIARPQIERTPAETYAQRTWLAELSQQYLRFFPDQESVPELGTASLEILTNALIITLGLDVVEKQRLLEIDDLITRAESVAGELQGRIESLRFLAPYRHGGGDPRRN